MKRTQEQMQATITEWQNSGLSKKAFCRDRKITYQTFHYWCKRLSSSSATGFDEVNVSAGTESGTMELTFPSGVRMTFQGYPLSSWLREVVK